MSHILAPHTTPVYLPATPSATEVITPSQSPVASTAPAKGGTTPSFLGSSVLPPQSGAPANEKKLLGS